MGHLPPLSATCASISTTLSNKISSLYLVYFSPLFNSNPSTVVQSQKGLLKSIIMVRILDSKGFSCFSKANIFLIATGLNYKSNLMTLAKKKYCYVRSSSGISSKFEGVFNLLLSLAPPTHSYSHRSFKPRWYLKQMKPSSYFNFFSSAKDVVHQLITLLAHLYIQMA